VITKEGTRGPHKPAHVLPTADRTGAVAVAQIQSRAGTPNEESWINEIIIEFPRAIDFPHEPTNILIATDGARAVAVAHFIEDRVGNPDNNGNTDCPYEPANILTTTDDARAVAVGHFKRNRDWNWNRKISSTIDYPRTTDFSHEAAHTFHSANCANAVASGDTAIAAAHEAAHTFHSVNGSGAVARGNAAIAPAHKATDIITRSTNIYSFQAQI
jgi:hypothetical protein